MLWGNSVGFTVERGDAMSRNNARRLPQVARQVVIARFLTKTPRLGAPNLRGGIGVGARLATKLWFHGEEKLVW